MELLEKFVQSKTGAVEDCEDEVFVGRAFAAVIDGATSQSGRLWNGRTGGQMAAAKIREALAELSPATDAFEAVETFTLAIRDEYQRAAMLQETQANPLERATACAVIFSVSRRELWFVGDCQALILHGHGHAEHLANPKRVDEINAAARALLLTAELAAGRSIEELRAKDLGREFIRPLLRAQRQFQNSARFREFSYWVIDGYPVSSAGVRIAPVPEAADELVLASDGYPRLFSTLAESEQFLSALIAKDPLLIQGDFKSTKGVQIGSPAHDDRAYLRLGIG